jgi:hypothetical protein
LSQLKLGRAALGAGAGSAIGGSPSPTGIWSSSGSSSVGASAIDVVTPLAEREIPASALTRLDALRMFTDPPPC